MTQLQAIAVVMAIVQFLKKVLPNVIQGPVAVVLVVLASVGVTAYKFLSEGTAFTFAAITFLIAVIIGALSGYGLLKVAGGTATPN
jgi:hypothetical protein